MSMLSAALTRQAHRRFRGAILELIHDGHHRQQPRYDHVMLWGVMRELSFDLGLNQVVTHLQQLRQGGFVTFKQVKNDWTNDIEISEIEITLQGVKIVEKTVIDDSIHVL